VTERGVLVVAAETRRAWADRSLPAPLFAEEYLGFSRVGAYKPIIGAASIVEGLARVAKDLTASVASYNVAVGEAAGGVADDPILAIADVACLEHDVSPWGTVLRPH